MSKFILIAIGLLVSSCHGTMQYVSGEGLAEPLGQEAVSPCNKLEQLGAEIWLTTNSGNPPTATGGTIVDGTYVLTASTLYTKDSPSGNRIFDFGRSTILIKGGTDQVIITSPSGKERRATVRRVQTGHSSTSTSLCTSPTRNKTTGSGRTDYTATKDTVMFINPGPAGTIVATYTRL